MSTFRSKLEANENITPADWSEHFKRAHKNAPGMSENAFASHRTMHGYNSYELLSRCISKTDTAVLDLACGNGILLKHILPKLSANASVAAVDISDDELATAKKNYPNVKFFNAPADKLPFEDNTFDTILCHMAMMLIAPIEPVIAEIHRVLKKGGKFVAIVRASHESVEVWAELRETLNGFVKSKIPNITKAPMGDGRVLSNEGRLEIFANLFQPLKVESDASLNVDLAPTEVWNFMKDMYSLTLLTEAEKLELKGKISALAQDLSVTGRVEFTFPMEMFGFSKL